MDKKEALKKVKNNGWDLHELDDKFKKDKDVVTERIKKPLVNLKISCWTTMKAIIKLLSSNLTMRKLIR